MRGQARAAKTHSPRPSPRRGEGHDNRIGGTAASEISPAALDAVLATWDSRDGNPTRISRGLKGCIDGTGRKLGKGSNLGKGEPLFKVPSMKSLESSPAFRIFSSD